MDKRFVEMARQAGKDIDLAIDALKEIQDQMVEETSAALDVRKLANRHGVEWIYAVLNNLEKDVETGKVDFINRDLYYFKPW